MIRTCRYFHNLRPIHQNSSLFPSLIRHVLSSNQLVIKNFLSEFNPFINQVTESNGQNELKRRTRVKLEWILRITSEISIGCRTEELRLLWQLRVPKVSTRLFYGLCFHHRDYCFYWELILHYSTQLSQFLIQWKLSEWCWKLSAMVLKAMTIFESHVFFDPHRAILKSTRYFWRRIVRDFETYNWSDFITVDAMVGLLPMKKASYRSQVLIWLNLHLVKLRNYDSIIVRFFDRSVKQLHARRADQRCLAFIQIYITRYICILKKSKQFIEQILGPSFLRPQR